MLRHKDLRGSTMRENKLRSLWTRGKGATNVWLMIPDSYATEIIAHQGFDSVTIDLQHGQGDFRAMCAMLTAVSTTETVPLVRVEWNDPGEVMRALDAGAYGVICPTINTREECERFVGACRYAPLGYRSVGANRASLYAGSDYVARANDTVLAIAQIETAEGLRNVEQIAKVKGLDMLYVGPSDLGLSLGREPRMDQTDPVVAEAIDTVLRTAKANKLRTGIYCIATDYSKAMLTKGFDLVTVASDAGLIAAGASQVCKQFTG
jgi:4-hydroxy-2-oxoheptanedioate aldolase